MKTISLICLLLTTSLGMADSEIYKWTDEDGNVHFSDCPPPPSCDAETIRTPVEPAKEDVSRAQQRLDEMLQEQQVTKAERERAKLEKERKRVLAMEVAVAMKRACIRARQNLQVLQVQKPVFYIDEKGEYVYLDEATRQAEIERMKNLVAATCAPTSD